jgi:hypothetical protein
VPWAHHRYIDLRYPQDGDDGKTDQWKGHLYCSTPLPGCIHKHLVGHYGIILDTHNMDGWFVYSCSSHLEHRASVKSFVSFQFLHLRHSVGLLGRVISSS